MPSRGPIQLCPVEGLISVTSSEYSCDVDSRIMHVVKYGTQLFVDNVDVWQLCGIPQILTNC
jgi:hypothetical protein